MCLKNDIIRRDLNEKLEELEIELLDESILKTDIETAKLEIQEIIDTAQCAIDNLSKCDFGGDKIISSVKTSQEGYQNITKYYEEYHLLCRSATEEIEEEIRLLKQNIINLPTNCGVCQECNPKLYEGTTVTLSNNSNIEKNNNKNGAQREVKL